MKLGGIFRFELGYQLRRVQTWAFIALPAIAAFLFTRDAALADAIRDDFYINSPFAIAGATVVGCLLWLLVAPSVAGDAAARDIETRMDPLAYTAPVGRTEYLGGRFLAAFALNALILLGTTFGCLAALYVPGVSGAAIGPFRAAGYLTAYGYLALPNAFVATAIQFSLATLNRRARAGYLGSMLLFFLAYVVSTVVFWILGRADIARLIDPIGVIITTEVLPNWTPLEKRTRLLELNGPLLWNRVLWLGIALAALGFTRQRFRFAHHIESPWWRRFWRRQSAQSPPSGIDVARTTPITIPHVVRTYRFGIRVRQTWAIAWGSFRSLATSPGGLAIHPVLRR
jgi:ABC-type transport system involved in multi-copper enzyme maturation permease subunit